MLREISQFAPLNNSIPSTREDVADVAICNSCNQNIADGTKFCNNCGAPVGATAPVVQAPAPAGAVYTKFCASCGNGLVASAVVCPSCGSPQKGFATTGGKSKTTAVLLAVFLSAWTWVYTYSVNAKKFWIAVGLWVLAIIFYAIGISSAATTFTCDPNGTNCNFHSSGGGTILFGWLIAFGVFLWALIDTASKPSEYFSAIK